MMLDFLPPEFIVLGLCGIAAGIASGLFGIGGGSLFVPVVFWWLSSFQGVDADTAFKHAVSHSLILVAITSFASARLHYRNGAVNLASVKEWLLPIVVGVVIVSILFSYLPAVLLAGCLLFALTVSAVLLLQPKLLQLFAEAASCKKSHRLIGLSVVDVWLPTLIGGISSAGGIGAGSLGVPSLQAARGLSAKTSSATASAFSFSVGFISSVILLLGLVTLRHKKEFAMPGRIEVTDSSSWSQLAFDWISQPIGGIYPIVVITIALGGIIGAPLGVRIHRKISHESLNKLFSLVLIAVALDIMRQLIG